MVLRWHVEERCRVLTGIIGDGDLRRTLQSLACGKKRVLRKLPPGKEVNDNDEFAYNADFADLNRKLHINSIQQKETVSLQITLSLLSRLIRMYRPKSPRRPTRRSRKIADTCLTPPLCGL